jgi:hypothetical protein
MAFLCAGLLYLFGPTMTRSMPLGGASRFFGSAPCNPEVQPPPRIDPTAYISAISPGRMGAGIRMSLGAREKYLYSSGVSVRIETITTPMGGASDNSFGRSTQAANSLSVFDCGSLTSHSARRSPSTIWSAKEYASGSFLENNISTGNFSEARASIFANCSWSIILGPSRNMANFASSNRASASAARALASAAVFVASASCLFDRLRNSVWIRASNLPKITSPTMPMAIAASAARLPNRFKAESYAGWTYAITNSAIIATTTTAAHPHSQVPQDDDADSRSASLAFIVPFGNRHAGKEFRGFWVGLGITALLFSLIFAASYLWG